MKELEMIYEEAVEQTKGKITDDIIRFMETKDNLPAFKLYLEERSQYIEQIWTNVWLNKSTNDVSKKDKKIFLQKAGFVTEGLDKKVINKLFRDEMRMYKRYDAKQWLINMFSENTELWSQYFEDAKVEYKKRIEQQRVMRGKDELRFETEKIALKVVNENRTFIYLKLRAHLAKLLKIDIESNPKYQDDLDTFALEEELEEQGSFEASDYRLVADFFEELTGAIHKINSWGREYFEYETYYYRYERIISIYLYELVSEMVQSQLSEEMKKNYENIFGQKLDQSDIKKMLTSELINIIEKSSKLIQEEYLEDLLELTEIPFEFEQHKEIYERNLAQRERREAEEQERIEREREAHSRMMEDIFGLEYSPSLGRNVKYILHIGETNTGKTHNALEKMKAAKSGLYLAPLRLLALEVYDKLNAEGVSCSLKTGEEEKMTVGATHLSCTVEMFYEKDYYECIVIDESQMIADKDRGFSWYKAITKANAKEVHLIGSKNIKNMLIELLNDAEVEIHEYTRDVPLQVEENEFSLSHAKKGDALVCFSRRKVLETAARLQNNGKTVSMIYGSMPPETRKKQMQAFVQGHTQIIVATDAIGMGLNLPIRRIVFLENEKFDGTRRRRLTSQEIKQIAGRAGRKGIYDIGKVAFMSDIKLMNQLLIQEDVLVSSFAIAPTNNVFERFQQYHRSLEIFFELWDEFESPKGTKKASLSEERELYELVRGTDIEARLSMMDLYGFLHLPFSSKEKDLIKQWLNTVTAIIDGDELPEPNIRTGSLEDLELTYKAIGLHLLFLYRLGRQTEAIYWERVRLEISDGVHESLSTEIINYKKKCRNCGKTLPWDSDFGICDVCHKGRYRQRYFHK